MVTFDPHPVSVFLPERAPLAVITVERRLQLAAELGIDAVLVIDFTRELRGLGPREYVDTLLVDSLHAEHVAQVKEVALGARPLGGADARPLGRELAGGHGPCYRAG